MSGRITAWRWRRGGGGSGSSGVLQRKPEHVDDYTGVLIPLDQAHLHSHSARCGRTEYEEVPGEDDDENGEGLDPKDSRGGGGGGIEEEDTGMLEMSAAEYSIEGLRKEVRKGAGGTRSVYESTCLSGTEVAARVRVSFCWQMWTDILTVKSMLINKAVQDIGMGKYNWQLFILCGFGWFADKYVLSLPLLPPLILFQI